MGIFQKNPFFGAKTAIEEAAEAEPAKPIILADNKKKGAEVDFDTFASVELRIGSVVDVEPVQGSEKLLKLSVDFGEGLPRTVLSGIAKHFAPNDLIGKQFGFVANLPPRAMMGLESHGMIMAADGPDGLALVSPTTPVAPGSRLH